MNRGAHGFSLVEVLVAMTVLSIGMLGIASLYVEGLNYQRSALYRTQAANLAMDLTEKIRANRNAGSAGDAYQQTPHHLPLLQNCAAASLGCTPIDLAQDDLSRWIIAIQDSLPGDGAGTPNGTVAVNTGTYPTTYTITITWSEPGSPMLLSYSVVLQT